MSAGGTLVARAARFRRLHHVIGAGLVFAWLLAMGGLVRARLSARASAPERSVADVLAGGSSDGSTRTFGVYHGDVKIGFSATRRMKTAGGWLFADQAVWDMALQGTHQRLVANTQAVVGEEFELKSFEADVDAGVAHLNAKGHIEGNELVVLFKTAGRSYEDRSPVTGSVVLPAMVRPSVVARNPKPGASYVFHLFNPIARGSEDIEVLVEDRETIHSAIGDVQTWRIEEILRGSIKTEVWIDDHGDTVREISPMGMRIEAEPRDMAVTLPAGAAAAPDLIMAVRVPVKGNLPVSAADGKLLVRLSGIDPKEFPLLAGGRQFLKGDLLGVDATHTPVGYPIPYSGGDHDKDLAAEPLIQSKDPEIVATARKAIEGTTDSVTAAMRLYSWVHDNLRKENSAGIPSAVEVLQTRSGDCNEHTTLYVALARAVGIPARMAEGVVWANARGGGPGVYYHAWPEVYLGRVGASMPGAADKVDGWYALDPTLGQFPADAGHLRFVVGGLEQQVDLLKLIGHLSLEVMDDSGEPIPEKKTP